MDKIYLEELNNLIEEAHAIPNSRMMAIAKVSSMIMLNIQYEKISENPNLKTHPYKLVSQLIKNIRDYLSAMESISFIEDDDKQIVKINKISLEEGHQELFQKLWVNFSKEDYNKRIDRYFYRLQINGLADGFLKGFKCIDFGCGHGNFLHAVLKAGGDYHHGIDFGKGSINYAKKARDRLGITKKQIEFSVETVYDTSFDNNTFDFAIQNGVFHHLENEDMAYNEVHRILKPGGWFWVYSDGSGCIKNELWDAAKEILSEIPYDFIISFLEYMNIETGKRYHLGDGLNAIYRFTTYGELTNRLESYGFCNFRRLVGGYSSDYDHDTIKNHNFGKEKFGEGNLRLLAQKQP